MVPEVLLIPLNKTYRSAGLVCSHKEATNDMQNNIENFLKKLYGGYVMESLLSLS